MRKLILQVQMSVDGFIGGENGEMDWITWDLDKAILKYISDLNRDVETILLGRILAEGFIPHWKMEATEPDKKRDFIKEMSGPYDFAEKMYETSKVVFTKSEDPRDWDFTRVDNGGLSEAVNALKRQEGGDMITYGGARFASSLIKARLIDEFHLFVNPVAIGKGLPIFRDLDQKQDLKLVKATPFECDIVVLHYELKK